MIGWTLILMLVSLGDKPAAALTTVQFQSRAECEAAGREASKEFTVEGGFLQRPLGIKFICVSR